MLNKILTLWGGSIGMLLLFCIFLLIFNPFEVEVQADSTDNLMPSPTPISSTAPISNTPTIPEYTDPLNDCNLNPSWLNWPNIVQWEQLMEDACQTHGVPVDLIASVMLQESGGNYQVVSASGAIGLMQVMPNDGIAASFQCLNGPCFATRPSTEELLDPEFNINFGTNMLAQLITTTNNLREALMFYGPMDIGYDYADIVLNIFYNQ